ncbi:MAG: thiazole synthase [Gammaproteobacteria bacterium]
MWKIADRTVNSRLILGTALYPSLDILRQAIITAEVDIITVSLRRQAPEKNAGAGFWQAISDLGCHVLPNTAGCRTAKEAVTMAHMARELFKTNWIKLEVIGDDYLLQPDPFGVVEAAGILLAEGFEVFPYCTDDLVLCQRLVDIGCKTLMPWGSPIGSGQGILNLYAQRTIRERLPEVNLILDAGIGAPSHAAQAMELGFDGILLDSAVALANDPPQMAKAFNQVVMASRQAYQAGLMPKRDMAQASTPLLDTPFWHQEKVS